MILLVDKESLNNKNLQKVFLCCLILLAAISHSQPDNLVVNGGFEQHSNCVPQGAPNQEQYLAYSYYWISPTLATPDFFHTCSNDILMGIPHNWIGFQNPHSGEAYGGGAMAAFLKPRFGLGLFAEDKEYLSYQLLKELDSGKTYCFSLFTSLGDGYPFHSPNEAYRVSAIKEIHVLFDELRPDYQTRYTIAETPSLELEDPNGDFLKDTLGWMFLRKPYSAIGGEQFFTLGNFTTTNELEFLYLGILDTLTQGGANVSYGLSYYYFDDISLVEIEDVRIIDQSKELVLTRPFTLQAIGWAEEYHWSTIENPNQVISTGNPTKVTLSEHTEGFILHSRNCEVEQFDTLFVTSLPPPPVTPVIKENLSLDQNLHTKSYMINYTGKDLSPLNVQLFNAGGQIIQNFVITQSTEIQVSGLSAGMYVCRITENKIPVLIEKLVVTK